MSANEYEAVVIGTGFGGAVAAARLAQAGVRTAVLERGKRYDSDGAFPRDWNNPLNGWLWGEGQGLFDVKPIQEMLVVQGAGYGGGSLIYANVHIRPPPEVFEQGWPRGYSREALDPYFDLVAYMLDLKPITEAPMGLPRKTRLLSGALDELGRREQTFYPNLALDFGEPGVAHTNKFGVRQAGCTFCGECDIGCRIRAKNTLDFNYLAIAESKGAVVRTLCEVRKIEPASGGGYLVHYRNHATSTEEVLRTKKAFLCAGAINSTELLLRCRDDYKTLPNLSPVLGKRYSGNGDFLAFGFDTKAPNEGFSGPTITTAVVYDTKEKELPTWFTLQDGGYPREIGEAMQLLRRDSDPLHGAEILLHEELVKALRVAAGRRMQSPDGFPRTAVFLVMGRDRANGVIDLHPITRRLRIRWSLPENLPLYAAEGRFVDDVVEKMGGKPGFNPLWERVHQPVSVHNLGGCVMGEDPGSGVTDATGQVHGYPGLYVIDGGILPESTGVNPSHTIAAVAERNIEQVIRKWRGDPDWRAPERAKAGKFVEPLSSVVVPVGGTAPTKKLPVGMTFTETMKGFLLPATGAPPTVPDYVAAEEAAKRAHLPASFLLTITMSDLDRFLVEPEHMGLAVGSVHVSGITPPEGSPVTHGVFNLFEQTGELYDRKMLYGLPFSGADGKQYRLDGFKDVKDHGHFDVWGATSTLYTVIRQGQEKDGPVVAAGILRIHIPDFMRQLTTFRAINASRFADKATALARFNTFFLGSLWKVFVGPKIGQPDDGK